MRCIYADALKHDVLNQQFSLGQNNAWRFLELIDEQFTADVKPVVRGEWIGYGDGYADGYMVYDEWECDQCGYIEENDGEPPWYNFCPNCGADMRGERHEDD